jgi:dipeptidyl aminopeptidase/acylaminoacyl peptidase
MAGLLRALLESTSTLLADADAEGRLLVRSDRTGSMQLYELVPGDELRQCTALADPVGVARIVPGSRLAVIGVDTDGNEHHQLYLVDLDTDGTPAPTLSALSAVTCSPEHGHQLAGVSPSGDQIAYLSNRRNGVDFDLWVCDLPTAEHRMLFAEGGFCQPSSGYSPDGRYIAIGRPGPRPLDSDLVVVDAETGDWHVPIPHPDEAAQVGAPAWIDKSCFVVSSNVGRDLAGLVRHDLSTGETTPIRGVGEEWDADAIASADGGIILVIENCDGANRMRLFDPDSGRVTDEIPTVEHGVVVSYVLSPPCLPGDGSQIYYSLSTPRRPGDVWIHDRRTATTRQLTRNPSPIDPTTLASPISETVSSFDNETVPLSVYRPPAPEPPPVVVVVHGGPEMQAVQSFNPVVQALVAEGYGVVVPNVRGSAGYGKRYAALDDTTRRLDSVRDLEAVHTWLGDAGFDPERAALWGGSYGGYMVLAGLAFQSDRWAAGVDIVGISNLVTFLERTSDYRRAYREREYGSLAQDRTFLEAASPLTHVESMRAPLFVIHGRNDPRVPLNEAEQLVAALRSRGVPCELLVFDDEGHGLAHLVNRIDGFSRAIAFLGSVLRPNW